MVSTFNPLLDDLYKIAWTSKRLVNKDVKPKMAAKKWLCDGRLIAKVLIQVNLVPNPSEMWKEHHKLLLLYILPLVFAHLFSEQPFCGPHTFFTGGLLKVLR